MTLTRGERPTWATLLSKGYPRHDPKTFLSPSRNTVQLENKLYFSIKAKIPEMTTHEEATSLSLSEWANVLSSAHNNSIR